MQSASVVTPPAKTSRHTFRHARAMLLAEVGESIKTAQALLGHSDLETTLSTYAHAIPVSQRRAVKTVAVAAGRPLTALAVGRGAGGVHQVSEAYQDSAA